MVQLLKRLTLDFGSGHDLMVLEFEPRFGVCAQSVDPARDSYPYPAHDHFLSLSHSLSLSLINKH